MSKILQRYLDSWKPERFDWAESNCAHFICGWAKLVTGQDPIADAPSMCTPLHWVRWVESAGGIEQILTQRLKAQVHAGWMAQQGDIILMEGSMTGWTLGICVGRHVACLDGYGQVLFVEAEPIKAWRLETL